MSDFLRLREWFGFDDATRYVDGLLGCNHDGSFGSSKQNEDFFLAYLEAGFPMKIASGYYIPHNELGDDTFPTCYSDIRFMGDGSYESSDGVTRFYRYSSPLDVYEGNKNRQADLSSHVWVVGPVPFEDPSCLIYQYANDDFSNDFVALTWRDLVCYGTNMLLLSRKHVESLVQSAKEDSASMPVVQSQQSLKPEADLEHQYADEHHDSYPPELHAAIMLWEGLYVKGERNLHHSHSQAAELWINKNADLMPTVNQSNHGTRKFIDRLTTVTSPQTLKQKKD